MNHTTWPGFISGHTVLAAGPGIFQRELEGIWRKTVVARPCHRAYILKYF